MAEYIPLNRPPAEARKPAPDPKTNGSKDKKKDDDLSAKINRPLVNSDFVFILTQNKFIFVPTGDLIVSDALDKQMPRMPAVNSSGLGNAQRGRNLTKNSDLIAQTYKAEKITWAPGEPRLIKNFIFEDAGKVRCDGVTTYNLYRPPIIKHGNGDVSMWLNHIEKLYGDDGKYLVKCFAHRVQRPGEKINHAVIMGGKQGIGKDTIIEPLRQAIGPANFQETDPAELVDSAFNPYRQAVVLRINEVQDGGKRDMFKMYDKMKVLAAAPPYSLKVNDKHVKVFMVPNVMFPIITANENSVFHIPKDDRRMFVLWNFTHDKSMFESQYWLNTYDWYENKGGYEDVAGYLARLDISDFNPKAEPPKTQGWYHITSLSISSNESLLWDVINEHRDCVERCENCAAGSEKCRPPKIIAVTTDIRNFAGAHQEEIKTLLNKSRRSMQNLFGNCGYIPLINRDNNDGQWEVQKVRQLVYHKRDVPFNEATRIISERNRR